MSDILTDLRFVSSDTAGHIVALDPVEGVHQSLSPGSILWRAAIAGAFGPVLPYEPPPVPEVPPEFPTLTHARAALSDLIEVALAPLVEGVPPPEVQSWPVKLSAAIALRTGSAGGDALAMLQAEADAMGEAIEDLAARVIAAALPYSRAVGAAAGVRRAHDARLVAVVDPYDFAPVIEDARAAMAQAVAAALGAAAT